MARPSLELADALRRTAKRIGAARTNYDWKNIGACNCGNLVQIVTGQEKREIHMSGIQKHGDWEMLVYLFKENSKYEIDKTIKKLVDFGFALEDIVNLENLSCPVILGRLPEDKKYLKRDRREDVILYLETWAEMIEEQLMKGINIGSLEVEKEIA
jgi:hypothetical protein